MTIPIIKTDSNSNSNSPTSSNNKHRYSLFFVGWRIVWTILQGIFVIVVVISFCQGRGQQLPCAITTTSSSSSVIGGTKTNDDNQNLRQPKRVIDNPNVDDEYTRPISDRVPAEGIETILATSSTTPSFHFFLHAKHNDFVTESILKSGVYEKDSTTALIDTIVCGGVMTNNNNNNNKDDNNHNNNNNNKPMLVLDLGANIGFHSLHMASCGAHVISFEASPDTAWLLQSSATLNGFSSTTTAAAGPLTLPQSSTPANNNNNHKGTITLIPRGVSNSKAGETARLSRHPKSPGMTSFVGSNDKTPYGLQPGSSGTALDVDIPLVRVQDVLYHYKVTADNYNLWFVKMDVEGFELKALQGLDLKNQFPFQYITFEFFPTLLKAAGGTDPIELLVYIWNQGYRYLDINNNNNNNNQGATSSSLLDKYPETFMGGGSTESDVRKWAQNLIDKGYQNKKQDFHVNLLARRVVL